MRKIKNLKEGGEVIVPSLEIYDINANFRLIKEAWIYAGNDKLLLRSFVWISFVVKTGKYPYGILGFVNYKKEFERKLFYF